MGEKETPGGQSGAAGAGAGAGQTAEATQAAEIAARIFESGRSGLDSSAVIAREAEAIRAKSGQAPAEGSWQKEEQEEEDQSGEGAEDAEGEKKSDSKKADTRHPLQRLAAGEQEEDEEVEIPAPVIEWMKSQGIESPSTTLNELPTLRASLAERDAELSKLRASIEYFERLSPEARNVIALDLDGKDWKKEVIEARPHNLDYRLTYEKQDKKALSDLYAPDEITAEQWEDYNSEYPDPMNKKFIDSVLKRVEMVYGQEREQVTTLTSKRNQEIKDRRDQYTNSRKAAIEYVSKSVPGADAYMADIEQAVDDIAGLFFEKDGVTLKQDAALNAWLIKNRDVVLGSQAKKAEQAARSGLERQLLRREPAKAAQKQARGTGGGKTVEQEAQEIAAEIFADGYNPGRRR